MIEIVPCYMSSNRCLLGDFTDTYHVSHNESASNRLFPTKVEQLKQSEKKIQCMQCFMFFLLYKEIFSLISLELFNRIDLSYFVLFCAL